jgi:hypothetical protein
MSPTTSFVRSRKDAQRIAAAHRAHRGTPHFGCPLCIIDRGRDALPRWTAPRRG